MNNADITNAFYEAVKESLEWTDVFDNKEEYASFLHGITVMASKMMDMYCNKPYHYNEEEYGREDVNP